MDYKDRLERFNKICSDIKSLRVQGARNVALEGLKAYKLIPSEKSKKKIFNLRPTEPLLAHVLEYADDFNLDDIKDKLDNNQDIMNKAALMLIKNDDVIFTHCHSSSVVKALIYAKKRHKRFEIYNTETRPLYQGQKTAKELAKADITVTMFVDSSGRIALLKTQDSKKVDLVFLGADAVIKKGVINKVGSGMFADIAYQNKIPVFIVCDSWKYFPKNIKIEERDFHEVYDQKKNSRLKIRNPAFELIPKKFITGIVSELGVLSFKEFLKKVKRR